MRLGGELLGGDACAAGVVELTWPWRLFTSHPILPSESMTVWHQPRCWAVWGLALPYPGSCIHLHFHRNYRRIQWDHTLKGASWSEVPGVHWIVSLIPARTVLNVTCKCKRSMSRILHSLMASGKQAGAGGSIEMDTCKSYIIKWLTHILRLTPLPPAPLVIATWGERRIWRYAGFATV